ncbi:glycosyltransferase, partial [Enterococcus faecium]
MCEISIIVPVYKVEKYLRKCVDSILAQTFTDFEVILVDDGSPDNSGKICDEYAEKDNRVRVIHKENGGLSSARNAGIDVARGKYLGFVDSDDYIDEDMYEILYENLKIHDADISSVELIPFYGDRYKKA